MFPEGARRWHRNHPGLDLPRREQGNDAPDLELPLPDVYGDGRRLVRPQAGSRDRHLAPVLLRLGGVWVGRLRRIPFILEVRDLWPESIVAVGAMRAGAGFRFLEWLEKRMYAAASRIVTVGEGYRDQLTDRGVAAERIDIVPNGVDRGLFADRGGGSVLREKFDLGDAFVCSYIGTIGMGSGLEVVLRAARLLREARVAKTSSSCWSVMAPFAKRWSGGPGRKGSKRVVFTGRQDKRTIPDFLSMTDACLVHLVRRDLFRTVLPSKIFEAAAMKKPIILGVEGSAAQIVGEANAGICIEPENEAELVEAVTRLARDRDLAGRMGQAGFDSIAAVYDYDRLAEKYAEIIERVAVTGHSRLRGVKIINVVGARPNLMKIRASDERVCEVRRDRAAVGPHRSALRRKHERSLLPPARIPEPDLNLEVGSASHAVQTAEIMKAFEPVVLEHEPDAVLVVGDVNSTIACGTVAVKLGVKLIHVEAGLRSFDRTMPEEINRMITDAISDLLFCTEQSGVDNLRREGVPEEKIHFVGNVMIDTLLQHRAKADQSTILEDLALADGGYAVITLHRPANVDNRKASRG